MGHDWVNTGTPDNALAWHTGATHSLRWPRPEHMKPAPRGAGRRLTGNALLDFGIIYGSPLKPDKTSWAASDGPGKTVVVDSLPGPDESEWVCRLCGTTVLGAGVPRGSGATTSYVSARHSFLPVPLGDVIPDCALVIAWRVLNS